jgi:4-diphosphocytidyl-2-C-methyl-D-erythritol kinase
MNSIELFSYAKLNIGLYIKAKRRDGFHELQSLFQEISLADKITIKKTRSNRIELRSNWADIPLDERNTAYRATQLLNVSGVEIHLEKKIPHEAGLGGGSSNAAAVLSGLNTFLKLGKSKAQLCELAAKIGSDVPFFLHGGAADVQGRGELICPLKLAMPYFFVIIKPQGVSFSTAAIYSAYAPFLADSAKNADLDNFYKKQDIASLKKLRNDLEKAIPSDSIIFKLKSFLLKKGAAYAAMTGSGSVVFGVFESEPPKIELDNCDIFYTSSRNVL